MTAETICPRQKADGFYLGGPATWRDNGTCSYCGSMTPERFFECVEAGNELVPTDKNYKVYVRHPNPLAGQMTIRSSANFQVASDWIEATPEVCEQYGWKPYGDGPHWVNPSPEGPTETSKFYFYHLDEAGMHRFIELLNGKRMKLAYPGHFYVPPFFVRFGAPAETAKTP
ncbi:hypothetical protein [uncultured Alsobacter sp.]|uniref:hypothetical protein n=1 Tax=uncultured Alsobacter sp. TaxID=1748258 RepID=UPI0025CF2F6D|nr:hypothetical protein [uncultured Alsobacter sp.]